MQRGVSPKGKNEILPDAQGTTDEDYQEDSEKKKKLAPKTSTFTPAGKKIKLETITRWSRLYKRVYTRQPEEWKQ
ncbi:unnamed protein product [Enterobius vermicularis]|uniref:Uncharacterized protein n=1 Tax=Enterobius vermicularis TaxID=51028 RepID=A0A0N4UXM9_ENTVE|nr:unnamed protein product [Enterobius vermicularis]